MQPLLLHPDTDQPSPAPSAASAAIDDPGDPALFDAILAVAA